MSTKHGLAHRLYTGQVSYHFIGHRKLWFGVSALLLTVSILALIFRGLSLGIEFRGGTDFQAPMPITATTVDDVRQKVKDFEVKDLEAQVFALGDKTVRVQTRSLSPEETTSVRAAVAQVAGVEVNSVTYNAIGASWGQQISKQAAIALAVFIVLVMLLIWVWFRDWKMSVAAIVALVHDILLTVGIYALVGFTVTPATLIGLLTILGYSLYDTVVVFDKIKENVRGLTAGSHTYSDRANLAVNQVLIRSLNTTIIGVLPVAALLVGGIMLNSGPLEDLGLVLFIGMLTGAYSSIFIATPILAWLKEREPQMVEHRATIERRRERQESRGARKGASSVTLVESGATSLGEAVPTGATASSQRTVRRTHTTRAERKKRP